MNYYLNVTDKDYKKIMRHEYSSLYNRIEEFREVGIGDVDLREDFNYFLSKLNRDIPTLESILDTPQDTRTFCKVCSVSFEDYLDGIQNKLHDLTKYKESLFELIDDMS